MKGAKNVFKSNTVLHAIVFFYVVNYMDSCLDVTISMPEVRALRYSTSVLVLAVAS